VDRSRDCARSGRDVLAAEPAAGAVFVEDSAALIGLCLAASGLLLTGILHTSVPDAIASLSIGLLLAVTAFGLARPFGDFLVGRSIPPAQLERLHAIIKDDAAIEEVLSLHAVYEGPEEVIVLAKVHPTSRMNIDQLGRAMDDLDHRIRLALPFVADVYIDVTANRAERDPEKGRKEKESTA
jgi:divalent metal cation (Fe/Co/Zn/Cd) transporter